MPRKDMSREEVHTERIIKILKELDENPGPCEIDILVSEIARILVRVERLEARVTGTIK